ncbi:unnamed protein product, partial [Vitis vinifera]|uniref:Uncharacterized protein n=1 Tax=Vitis vinifera TaxID=29760 RepID=D7TBM9_VITVI
MGYLYINSATHHANPSSPPIHLATSQHRNQKGFTIMIHKKQPITEKF